MELSNFWLQLNSGKKEKPNNVPHGVRQEQLDKKHAALFSIFDANKDGVLESEELSAIKSWLKAASELDGNNNELSLLENLQLSKAIMKQFNISDIEDLDFAAFIMAVSDASKEITSVEEDVQGYPAKPGFAVGERVITTKYTDGTTEEIYLYPNGEFKKKVTIIPVAANEVWYTLGEDERKITPAKLENTIKSQYKQYLAARTSETSNRITYGEFKSQVMERYSITKHTEEMKTVYSQRYQRENAYNELSKQLYSLLTDKAGGLTTDEYNKIAEQINSENILDFIEIFENNFSDNGLLELITSRLGNNDSEMKEALIGQNGIYTKLLQKAKSVGLTDNMIESYRNAFTQELNNVLSGITISPDVTRLNGIMVATRNSIKLYEENPELLEAEKTQTFQEQAIYEEAQKKATVHYTRELVSQARALLESHLEYLKENMVKNFGEIALEDLRFYIIGHPILKAFNTATNLLAKKAGFDIDAFTKSIHTKIDELRQLEADLTELENHAANSKAFETKYKLLLGTDYMSESMNALTNLSQNPPWKNDFSYIQYRQEVTKLTLEYREGKFGINEYFKKLQEIPAYTPDTKTREYKQYSAQLEQVMQSIAGKNYTENVMQYISTSGQIGSAIEMALFVACTMGMGSTAAGAGWVARGLSGAKVFAGYSAARGSLNFVDDALKLTKVSDKVGWTDTKSFEEFLGDRQNISFGGVLIGEKNAANFLKAISVVKDWVVGNKTYEQADKEFKQIDGFSFDDFVTSNGGQLVINTSTSAVFGFVMGAASTSIEKIGEFGTRLSQKLGAEVPQLDEIAIKLLEKNANGMSAVDFLTQTVIKAHSNTIAGISAKFAAETALFFGTNLSMSVVQEILSESNTELEDAWAKGPEEFSKYLVARLGQEAVNLLQVKSIGMIVAMLMGMNQASVVRENYSEFETLNNLTVKLEEINGVEGIADGTKCIVLEGPAGKIYVEGSLAKFYGKNGGYITEQNFTNGQPIDAVANLMSMLNLYMAYDSVLTSGAYNKTQNTSTEKTFQTTEPFEGNGPEADTGKQSVNVGDVGKNPANPVGTRITQEWIMDGIEHSAPEMVLKSKANPMSQEVSELIFSGRLGEHLTGRYEALSDALKDFSKKNSYMISMLYKQYGGSNELFAREFIRMLAKEFGHEDYIPNVTFSMDSSNTTAKFSQGNNTITVLKDLDMTHLCEILVHEYTHALQFYDVLSTYGKEGLREIVMRDKKAPLDKKEKILNQLLGIKTYAKIISEAKPNKPQGSVDEYLSRIYKQEYSNVADADENFQAYISQVVELEAYFLQFNNGLDKSLAFAEEMMKPREKADTPIEIERNNKVEKDITKLIGDLENNLSFRQLSEEELKIFTQQPEFVEFKICLGGKKTQQVLTKLASLMRKYMPQTYEYLREKLGYTKPEDSPLYMSEYNAENLHALLQEGIISESATSNWLPTIHRAFKKYAKVNKDKGFKYVQEDTHYFYVLDGSGNKIRDYHMSMMDGKSYDQHYVYDGNKITHRFVVNDKGQLQSTIEYFYDENGKETMSVGCGGSAGKNVVVHGDGPRQELSIEDFIAKYGFEPKYYRELNPDVQVSSKPEAEIPTNPEDMKQAILDAKDWDSLRALSKGMKAMPVEVKELYVNRQNELKAQMTEFQQSVVNWNIETHSAITEHALEGYEGLTPEIKKYLAETSKMPDLDPNETVDMISPHFYDALNEDPSFGTVDDEKNNALSRFISHTNAAKEAAKAGNREEFLKEVGYAIHFLQDGGTPPHTEHGNYLHKLFRIPMHVAFERGVLIGATHRMPELKAGYTYEEIPFSSLEMLFHNTALFTVQPENHVSYTNIGSWPEIQQRCYDRSVNVSKAYLDYILQYMPKADDRTQVAPNGGVEPAPQQVNGVTFKAQDVIPRELQREIIMFTTKSGCQLEYDGNMVVFTKGYHGPAIRVIEVNEKGEVVKDISGKEIEALYPHSNGTKQQLLDNLKERYGNIHKTESFASDDGYVVLDGKRRVKIHLDFDGDNLIHESQYEYYGDTDKILNLIEYTNGQLSDVSEYYYDENPPFSVKYKAGADKAEVWIYDGERVAEDLFMTPDEYHARFNRELPYESKLGVNVEVNSGVNSGVNNGVNPLQIKSLEKGFLKVASKYVEEGYMRNDFKLAVENATSIKELEALLNDAKTQTEVTYIKLRLPENTLQEAANAKSETLPANLSESTKTPEKIEVLQNEIESIIGEKYYNQIDWEKYIPSTLTPEEKLQKLEELKEDVKYFSRVKINEHRYGKDINWAHNMNEIAKNVQELINNGTDFKSVIDNISTQYGERDNSGREQREGKVGVYRGNTPDTYEEGWGITEYNSPYGIDGADLRDKNNIILPYEEYIDRLEALKSTPNGSVRTPYEEFTAICVAKGSDKKIIHPRNSQVNKNMEFVEAKYKEFQSIVEKYQQTKTLTDKELKEADDVISEVYYLLAHTTPYSRGSNGICDVLMRSMYKAIGVDMPVIKKGVGLDLEAFVSELGDYKNNWRNFFEGGADIEVKTYVYEDTVKLKNISEILQKKGDELVAEGSIRSEYKLAVENAETEDEILLLIEDAKTLYENVYARMRLKDDVLIKDAKEKAKTLPEKLGVGMQDDTPTPALSPQGEGKPSPKMNAEETQKWIDKYTSMLDSAVNKGDVEHIEYIIRRLEDLKLGTANTQPVEDLISLAQAKLSDLKGNDVSSLESKELSSELKSSLENAKTITGMAQKVTLTSKESGISINLKKLKGTELISAFDKFFKSQGMEARGEKYAFFDDGICVIKNNHGEYQIEVYGDNFFGIDRRLTYNSFGDLVEVERVFKNSDGSYVEKAIQCSNGKIHSVRSTTANSSGYVQLTDDDYDINQRHITNYTNGEEGPAVSVPDGYVLDGTTGKIIKVNVDNIQIEKSGNERGGNITIKDEFGNELGQVGYGIHENDIYFHSLESSVNGVGIGTKLIEELKAIAEEKGCTLSATAAFSPMLGGGTIKPASNLKFYYKMGFRAVDPQVDKIVQECIEKDIQIPVSLNSYVNIKYVGGVNNASVTNIDSSVGIKSQISKPVAEGPHPLTPSLKGRVEADLTPTLSPEGEGAIAPSPIPPRTLPYVSQEGALNVYGEYKAAGKEYPHFDYDNGRFSDKAHATTMELVKPNPNETMIHVDQMSIEKTVAGSSTLDQALYTDKLLQCAALAVVDKKNNKQSLIHVYPGHSVEDNKQIIEYILSQSNPEDLELSVVNGVYETTTYTIQSILDTLHELVPDNEVKLFNFPRGKDLKVFNRGLILKDGKLTCCEADKVTNTVVNPKDHITYCAEDNAITESEQGFESLYDKFEKEHKSYYLYSNKMAENVNMIVAVAGERPNPAAAVPFTYDVYRFDKYGNPVETITGLSQKEAKKYELEYKQFVDNSISDNSGSLNMELIPLPKKFTDFINKLKGGAPSPRPTTMSGRTSNIGFPTTIQRKNIAATTAAARKSVEKPKQKVELEFKPDETDERKFTLKEFLRFLTADNRLHRIITAPDGTVFIEITTMYEPQAGGRHWCNIYKYDKDGNFVGIAENVEDDNTKIFYPEGSYREFGKYDLVEGNRHWVYNKEVGEGGIERTVGRIDISQIQYKGETPQVVLDAKLDEKDKEIDKLLKIGKGKASGGSVDIQNFNLDSPNKVEIEFKPDETDDYKFTLEEFKKVLESNQRQHRIVTTPNGETYIEITKEYSPGGYFNDIIYIYKYDKDGKFVGVAENVDEKYAEKFYPKGSERSQNRGSWTGKDWTFDINERGDEAGIFDISQIQYKGDYTEALGVSAIDELVQKSKDVLSRMSQTVKLKYAKAKLEVMKPTGYDRYRWKPEEIEALAPYYLQNPKAIQDVMNNYGYRCFRGAKEVDLAIMNVKTNGAVAELAEMQDTISGGDVVSRFKGEDNLAIAELSLQTNGLAMEFARIPYEILKDGHKLGGYSVIDINQLCNLSEKYGKDLVLGLASIMTKDNYYGAPRKAYWAEDIKSLLQIGEEYGQDVVLELAKKTGGKPGSIRGFAHLNKEYNGLFLELISGDMEYQMKEDSIARLHEDWAKLLELASRDEDTKQNVKELLTYRDTKGKMRLSAKEIEEFIEKDLYPKYKTEFIELVNGANAELPKGQKREKIYTYNPATILEAYAKHKDIVLELSKIEFKRKGDRYGEQTELKSEDIAGMAQCWAERPEDAKYIMETYFTVKPSEPVLGESSQTVLYENRSYNDSNSTLISRAANYMKLNSETNGLVVKYSSRLGLPVYVKDFKPRDVEDGFRELAKDETSVSEMLSQGIDMQSIDSELVELYKANKEDFKLLTDYDVNSRTIRKYLSSGLCQNHREAFKAILESNIGAVNSINEDVVKAYEKDSQALLDMIKNSVNMQGAAALINKDFFEPNKTQIFEMIEALINPEWEEHSSHGKFIIAPVDIDLKMVKLFNENREDFAAIVARLDSYYNSENYKTMKNILKSPLYQKNKPEYLQLLDMGFSSIDEESTKPAVTKGIIQSLINNGIAITSMTEGKIIDKKAFEKIKEKLAAFGTTFEEVRTKLKNLEHKMLEHPELYVNGEFNNIHEMRSEIVSTIGDIKEDVGGGLFKLATVYDKEALDALMRMRLDDVEEYTDIINEMSEEDMMLLHKVSQSCNIDGKPFMPKQKIDFMNLLQAFKECRVDKAPIEEMLKPDENGIVRVDMPQLNKILLSKVMKDCGMSEEEIQAIPAERLMGWDFKYLHLLAREMSDPPTGTDRQAERFFISIANSSDFKKVITNISSLSKNPEPDTVSKELGINIGAWTGDFAKLVSFANTETKVEFESIKADFDVWFNTPKELEINFQTKDAATDIMTQVAETVTKYLTGEDSVRSRIGKMFDKRFHQYLNDGKFAIPQDVATNQNKLIEFIEQLLPAEEGQPPHILDDMWSRAQANLSNPDRADKAQNTLTIQYHLKEELEKLKGIKSQDGEKVKAQKPLNLSVGMWDRNPQTDIFQNNYTTCCIGMNECNGHAMFHYMMDAAYNFITVRDNDTGEILGNALCYMAKNDKGEPYFIIDNIEISNSSKPSKEACKQIRQQMTNYAARVSKAMFGREDVPVYMSGNYNDVPTGDLKSQTERVSLVGECTRAKIYMDLFGGWWDPEDSKTCTLYKLEPDETAFEVVNSGVKSGTIDPTPQSSPSRVGEDIDHLTQALTSEGDGAIVSPPSSSAVELNPQNLTISADLVHEVHHSDSRTDVIGGDDSHYLTEAEIEAVKKQLKAFCKKYKYYLDSKTLLNRFDFNNAERHFKHLEMVVKYYSYNEVSKPIIDKGYFDSKEGADAFDYLLEHFSTERKGTALAPALTYAKNLTPEEVFRIEKRNLKHDNKLIDLAKLSDAEYQRYLESNYKDVLIYVSKNENVNQIFVAFNKMLDIRESKKIESTVLREISKNPDKAAETTEFLKQLAKDCDGVYEYTQKLKSEVWLESYKKAYEYTKNNFEGEHRIVLVNPKHTNIYGAGGVFSVMGDVKKTNYDVIIFDEEGNFIRRVTAGNSNEKIHEVVTTPEVQHLYQAEIDTDTSFERKVINNSRKEFRDSNGKLLFIETYEKSADIDNKYDIYREYPDGKKYKVGLAEKSPAGDIIIEKTLKHANGSKTDYNYVESPNGSRLAFTQITDKDGNVTVSNRFQYKVIDDNHFKTIENGIEYDIEYKENKVVVKRSDGAKVTVDIGRNEELFEKIPALSRIFSGVLSRDLLPLLKKMPGSFYFDIDEFKLNKIGKDINGVEANNAHYSPDKNLISISNGWAEAIFTLSHEFGHYLFNMLKLDNNTQLKQTYLRERQEATTKIQSNFEAQSMNYLLSHETKRTGDYRGSLGEMAADIFALLYSSNEFSKVELRSQFLQEYYPETFAIIANAFLKHYPKAADTRFTAAVGKLNENVNAASTSQIPQLSQVVNQAPLTLNETLVSTDFAKVVDKKELKDWAEANGLVMETKQGGVIIFTDPANGNIVRRVTTDSDGSSIIGKGKTYDDRRFFYNENGKEIGQLVKYTDEEFPTYSYDYPEDESKLPESRAILGKDGLWHDDNSIKKEVLPINPLTGEAQTPHGIRSEGTLNVQFFPIPSTRLIKDIKAKVNKLGGKISKLVKPSSKTKVQSSDVEHRYSHRNDYDKLFDSPNVKVLTTQEGFKKEIVTDDKGITVERISLQNGEVDSYRFSMDFDGKVLIVTADKDGRAIRNKIVNNSDYKTQEAYKEHEDLHTLVCDIFWGKSEAELPSEEEVIRILINDFARLNDSNNNPNLGYKLNFDARFIEMYQAVKTIQTTTVPESIKAKAESLISGRFNSKIEEMYKLMKKAGLVPSSPKLDALTSMVNHLNDTVEQERTNQEYHHMSELTEGKIPTEEVFVNTIKEHIKNAKTEQDILEIEQDLLQYRAAIKAEDFEYKDIEIALNDKKSEIENGVKSGQIKTSSVSPQEMLKIKNKINSIIKDNYSFQRSLPEDFWDKFDYANADIHIKHIKELMKYDYNNGFSGVCDGGYFYSEEGAEVFEDLKAKYPIKEREFSIRTDFDLYSSHIKVQQYKTAKARGLFDNDKLSYSKVAEVADWSDEQYAKYKHFVDKGITYVTDNPKMNELFYKIADLDVTGTYELKKIESKINELAKGDKALFDRLIQGVFELKTKLAVECFSKLDGKTGIEDVKSDEGEWKMFHMGYEDYFKYVDLLTAGCDNGFDVADKVRSFIRLTDFEKIKNQTGKTKYSWEIDGNAAVDRLKTNALKNPELYINDSNLEAVDAENAFKAYIKDGKIDPDIKTLGRVIQAGYELAGDNYNEWVREEEENGDACALGMIKSFYNKNKAAISELADKNDVEGLTKLIDDYFNAKKLDESVKEINDFFEENRLELIMLSSAVDKEALDVLMRKRLNDVEEYLDIVKYFHVEDLQLLEGLSNSLNIDGQSPFGPNTKIEFIDLIQAYTQSGLSTQIMRDMITAGRVDVGELHRNLFNQIMLQCGMTQKEIDATPLERLMSWDIRYVHLLAKEMQDEEAKEDLSALIRAANEGKFEEFITNPTNKYGKANMVTKALFSRGKMKFNAWEHPDKALEMNYKFVDENAKAIKNFADQLIEDINMLRYASETEIEPETGKRKTRPTKKVIEQVLKTLIPDFDGEKEIFTMPEKYLKDKNSLLKLVQDILAHPNIQTMKERATQNKDNPKFAAAAGRTLTSISHMETKVDGIKDLKDGKTKKSYDLTIKMWDRDPFTDIYSGNESTCCIGMGAGNGRAMTVFVMNKSYNMIEIKDNITGKEIGNALCYFVKDKSGNPMFIVDNIEISNSHKLSTEVGAGLRNMIGEYAQRVAKGVTGRDDIPVYMSGSYNDVPVTDLNSEKKTVTFFGDFSSDDIYMDLYDGWVTKSNMTKSVKLFRLK